MLTRSSEVHVLDVPSSAPPSTPTLLYAVPTLRWEDLSTPDAQVTLRHGGGVRVWLERGWWSSGAGERLGVVFGPAVLDVNDPRCNVTSFVGQDPTRVGGAMAAPTRATFGGAVQFVDGVPLLEDVGLMSLATFKPVFDPTSDRWYCDIDLDTGTAYLPLLRLALVRYQPHAIEHCAVSTVVLVDLVQTLPERTLTVTHAAADETSRTITVVGPSYTATAGLATSRSDPSALAVVRCTVQRRQSGAGDDPLAWVEVPRRRSRPVALVHRHPGHVDRFADGARGPAGHRPAAPSSGGGPARGRRADAFRRRIPAPSHLRRNGRALTRIFGTLGNSFNWHSDVEESDS